MYEHSSPQPEDILVHCRAKQGNPHEFQRQVRTGDRVCGISVRLLHHSYHPQSICSRGYHVARQGQHLDLTPYTVAHHLNNLRAKATLPGHADEVYALDWSPDGSAVASGSKDRTIKIWAH